MTLATAAKAAATILANEKLRKTAGWIIAAILSPIIVITALLCGMLSGMADHNNAAVNLCFNGGVIAGAVPESYRSYIEDMRGSFAMLDATIAIVNAQMEDGSGLDSTRVKAIFYALYFGAESPSLLDHVNFVNSFVTFEERTRPVEGSEEQEGETTEDETAAEEETETETNEEQPQEETYTVAIPIRQMATVYANIAQNMGTAVTQENIANATEIYYRVLYGSAPTYGAEFDAWSDGLPLSEEPFVGADGFCSPLGAGWRGLVTSEFGYRHDPITGQTDGHTGLDMASPRGTAIRAALPGTVYLVRYTTTGYGYHVMIDHGGGFVTLYGHCSAILVSEGQQVQAGDVIAQVGTTGRSTGNHLHFEVRIGGVKQNPRSYLP